MTREEMLDGLYEIKNWKCDGDSKMYKIITEVIRVLEQEPKTGHWIERKNIPKSVDIATANLRWKYECSECEYEVRSKYHFCPACGARMCGDS